MTKYICLLCKDSYKYTDSSCVRKHAKSKHCKELKQADKKKIKIFKKVSDTYIKLENLINNDPFLNKLFMIYDPLYDGTEFIESNKDHDYLLNSIRGLCIKLKGEPNLVSKIDLSI